MPAYRFGSCKANIKQYEEHNGKSMGNHGGIKIHTVTGCWCER